MRHLKAAASLGAAGVLAAVGVPAAAPAVPKWIAPGPERVSEHIRWARPAARGPLRVLFITPRSGFREVVEFQQRFDADCQVLALERWNRFHSPRDGMNAEIWPGLDEESVTRRFREKLAADYDVLVAAGIVWDALPDWVRQIVLAKVRAGTGLLVRLLAADGSDTGLPADWAVAVADPPVLDAFPFAALAVFPDCADWADFGRRHAVFGTLGRGRVVALHGLAATNPAQWGGPLLQIMTPECPGRFPALYPLHYEYCQALAGHLLEWAAARRRVVRLVPVPPRRRDRAGFESVPFTVDAAAAARVELEFALRQADYGDIAATAHTSVTIPAGRSTVLLPVNNDRPPPAGRYIADLWIRSESGTVAFGSACIELTASRSIAGLSLAETPLRSGTPVRGSVRLAGPCTGLRLAVRLLDNYGRETARTELACSAAELPFELRPGAPLTVLQTLEAALLADTEPLAVERQRFTCSDVFPPGDDLLFIICQPVTGNSYLNPVLARAYRDAGIDAWVFTPGNVDRQLLFAGAAVLANLQNIPTVYGRGTSGRNSVFVDLCQFGPLMSTALGTVRDPCLTDPVYVTAARTAYSEYGAWFAELAPVAFNLGDECNFAPHGSSHDVCFSDSCVQDFRDFAAAEYGTIAALNAEYGTAYESFAEVVPASFEQAVADPDRVPAWIDHRRHADLVWSRHLGRAREWLQEQSPGSRVGYEGSNDSGHGPRNGALTACDYGRLADSMDMNGLYYWPFQLAAVRDFSASGTLIGGGWFGGYGQIWRGSHDPLTQQWWVWNALLRGANSVWTFAGVGASHWSVVATDFAFYDYFEGTLEQVQLLKRGIAKLLLAAERCDDGVAVLYSPSSMLLAALADPKDGFWNNAAAVPIALQETGLQYRMLTVAALEAGALRRRGCRLLVLPGSQALSVASAARIREFVGDGGVLLADLRPGVADVHGKLRAQGVLDALFGVEQDAARARLVPVQARLRDSGWAEGLGIMPELHADASLKLAGGRAMAAADGIPAVIVNRVGAGVAVLLNLRLVDAVRGARDADARYAEERSAVKITGLLNALFGASGVEPEVRITPYLPGCRVHRFAAGSGRILGLLWDAPAFQPGAPALEPYLPGARGGDNRRAMAAAAERRETIRLDLNGAAHIYDILAGRYLGYADHVETAVQPGVPQLLAALPYAVERVRVRPAAARVSAGSVLRVELSIEPASAAATVHVFRVECVDPTGVVLPHYTSNVTASAGRAGWQLPLARNEATGDWTLRVRDVATGCTGSAAFRVLPAP